MLTFHFMYNTLFILEVVIFLFFHLFSFLIINIILNFQVNYLNHCSTYSEALRILFVSSAWRPVSGSLVNFPVRWVCLCACTQLSFWNCQTSVSWKFLLFFFSPVLDLLFLRSNAFFFLDLITCAGGVYPPVVPWERLQERKHFEHG